jgi:hypothetical protein
VILLATDRPEEVRAYVRDGARWGLRAVVLPELREWTLEEARLKYKRTDLNTKPYLLDVMVLLDHLPMLPEHRILTGYRAWHEGQMALLGLESSPNWIGMREVQPGIWVSRRARVASSARLTAPCWVGEGARVEAGAVVGPGAILGERSWVDAGAEVVGSVVGPDTLVGRLVALRDSWAWGNHLIHGRLDSSTQVADSFLLSSLVPKKPRAQRLPFWGRLAALGAMGLTLPLALGLMLKAKLRGRPVFRSCLAVRAGRNVDQDRETVLFYELGESQGWLRRWPQLWNVALGDFSWVGNRPLSPAEAATFTTEFERLWLAAPTGLFSHGEALGCSGSDSEEARAHAAYYTVTASWKLDLRILLSLIRRRLVPGPRPPGIP